MERFGDLLLRHCETLPARRFAAREHMYNWGEIGSTVYLVSEGVVKSTRSSVFGKSCVLRFDGPGDIVGLSCLMEERRTDTAVAKTDVTAMVISISALRECLLDERLNGLMYRYLASRIESQTTSLEHFVTLDSRHRVGATLLRLARQFGTPSGSFTLLRYQFTHEELSQMVGTTRSRVGHFLQCYENAGLIRRVTAGVEVDERSLEHFLAHG